VFLEAWVCSSVAAAVVLPPIEHGDYVMKRIGAQASQRRQNLQAVASGRKIVFTARLDFRSIMTSLSRAGVAIVPPWARARRTQLLGPGGSR